MKFKDRIKQLRLDSNMLQKELAEKIGVKRSTITKYEIGTLEPSLETLIKLSDIFSCSLDYLLGKSDTRNADTGYYVAIDPEKNVTTNDLNNLIEYIKKLKDK